MIERVLVVRTKATDKSLLVRDVIGIEENGDTFLTKNLLVTIFGKQFESRSNDFSGGWVKKVLLIIAPDL